MLAPSEQRNALITFRPSAVQPYAARLPLEVNGLYCVHVDLRGEGAVVRLEASNPAKRTAHFGGVQVGASASRAVSVVNRGKTAVTFDASPSRNLLQRLHIEMLPSRPVCLRPRESTDLTFFFKPPQRMRAFEEELVVDVGGVHMGLLGLAGACLGTELTLASDNLPFGPVSCQPKVFKFKWWRRSV